MDAKPQRPLRALRVQNDENAIVNNPIAAGGIKSLHHNRNKSSPSLLGIMKDGIKRAALNDKANFANRAMAREDSNAGGKFIMNTFAEEKISVQPLQKKASILNQPAQRPQGVAALKDKTNTILQPTQMVPLKNGGEEKEKPLQTTTSHKPLSRRNTMANFQDYSDAPMEKPSLNAQKLPPLTNIVSTTATSTTTSLPNATAPLAPVHRDLNTKSSKKALDNVDDQLSTIKEVSSQSIPVANMTRNKVPKAITTKEPSVEGPKAIVKETKMVPMTEGVAPFPQSLAPITQTQIYESVNLATVAPASIIGPFPTTTTSESTLASTNALLTELVAAQNAKAAPTTTQPSTIAADERAPTTTHTHRLHGRVSEPGEYWDEPSELENCDDEGFVTARSSKSATTATTKGDGNNTTGNATIVLVPKMNAKIRRELEAAATVIESLKTMEEIEDEAWDTSMVAEYGDEIFQHMRHLETHMSPNPYYMDNQTEIQWSMRSVLMDWLVQVHLRFNLLPETLFLTVNYIDRFLSSKIVSLGKLQLVGATAIFVAAKYEEITCPSVSEIVYMVDNGYTIDEILKAERFMLSMLQFELGWPGPMSFLRKISKADDYDLETRTLAKYFLEITIMDERFISSPPSFVAAGAHCLARMMLRKGNWTQAHVYYSGYTYLQIHPVVTLMLECCRKPHEHHNAIWEKYSDRRFKRASHFVQGEMRARFWVPSVSDHAAMMIDRELLALSC